ncbi:MAG TPA: hypothetical protein VGI64_22890 [Streptosporangiaceae bacterium]
MAENTTIWYRGSSYELGRGLSFYGIWPAGGGQWHPFEWWPLTPEGWSGAWARFTTIEAPTAIIQLAAPRQAGETTLGGETTPAGAATSAADASPAAPSGGGVQAAGPAQAAGLADAQPQAPAGTALAGAADSAVADRAATATTGSSWPATAAATGQSTADSTAAAGPDRRRRTLIGGGLAGRPAAAVALALTGLGVVLGIAGLFPSYLGGTSLASQAANVVPHVIYLAGWVTAALLILAGGSRQRAGALFGLGLGVVSFGLFFTDAGSAIAHQGAAGAGLTLSIAGWALATAGSAVALWQPALAQPGSPAAGQAARSPWAPARPAPAGQAFGQPAGWPQPGRPPAGRTSPLSRLTGTGPARGPQVAGIALVLAAIGVAVMFAPPWDSFTLRTPTGLVQTITLGNAFKAPAPVIAGSVVVMLALVAVAIAAALWRPARYGVALAAGAAIPMLGQLISALIGVTEPTPPTQFGLTPERAKQLGLTISNGLTAWFWIYCLFLGALLLSVVWLLITSRPAVSGLAAPAGPGWQPSAPGPEGFASPAPGYGTSPWQPVPADPVPSATPPGGPASQAGYPAGYQSAPGSGPVR